MPIDQEILSKQNRLEILRLETEAKCREMLKESEKKSAEIIEQSKLQAQEIIETAKNHAQEESDTIKNQAHQEGYAKGYDEGNAKAIEDLEDKFKAIDLFAKSNFDIKENIIKSAELDIIKLVVEIAEKVCVKSVEMSDEVLTEMTKQAIKLLKGRENITIMVNPELAERIYSISDRLREEIPQLESIKIIEDKNISADGTIVESLLSRVDTRVKSQIDEIAEKLMIEYNSQTDV